MLSQNNKYYQANDVHVNQEALWQLPEDGNLMDVRSLDLGESSTERSESSELLRDIVYEAHLSISFVPNTTQQRMEQETVAAVASRSAEWIITHPHMAHHWRSWINEFTTEGYFKRSGIEFE